MYPTAVQTEYADMATLSSRLRDAVTYIRRTTAGESVPVAHVSTTPSPHPDAGLPPLAPPKPTSLKRARSDTASLHGTDGTIIDVVSSPLAMQDEVMCGDGSDTSSLDDRTPTTDAADVSAFGATMAACAASMQFAVGTGKGSRLVKTGGSSGSGSSGRGPATGGDGIVFTGVVGGGAALPLPLPTPIITIDVQHSGDGRLTTPPPPSSADVSPTTSPVCTFPPASATSAWGVPARPQALAAGTVAAAAAAAAVPTGAAAIRAAAAVAVPATAVVTAAVPVSQWRMKFVGGVKFAMLVASKKRRCEAGAAAPAVTAISSAAVPSSSSSLVTSLLNNVASSSPVLMFDGGATAAADATPTSVDAATTDGSASDRERGAFVPKPMVLPGFSRLELLPRGCGSWREISGMLKASIPTAQLVGVERVFNAVQWRRYQTEKANFGA